MPPAIPASRAGATPEASGHGSSGTLGKSMNHILIYGDSLTWGIVPNTRRRLPFEERWPGVLEAQLIAAGKRIRIIEDCLNGRRTVWDDPFKPGRNGLHGIGSAHRGEFATRLGHRDARHE